MTQLDYDRAFSHWRTFLGDRWVTRNDALASLSSVLPGVARGDVEATWEALVQNGVVETITGPTDEQTFYRLARSRVRPAQRAERAVGESLGVLLIGAVFAAIWWALRWTATGGELIPMGTSGSSSIPAFLAAVLGCALLVWIVLRA